MSTKAFNVLITSLEKDVKAFVLTNQHPVEDSVFFLEEKGNEIMRTIFSKEEKVEAMAIVSSLLYHATVKEYRQRIQALSWLEKVKLLFKGNSSWH